ncbi:DNA cytosine methyltransferase [Paenibacillus dendritiformis]|uniref:DNA cytosine methyltransferase n=1 Tax=Paenibacillus dendritiformis TaxID=130049 RepID=UPI000DA71DE1|nr:DNA cytosine methyltransferase [Paenibacillus dendritiformis]PZM63714.1 DNA cytosine methyltransferase [Paenibacillus dendritiformis]
MSCLSLKEVLNYTESREIIVDNFAGGGGASTGIELATGRSVDIAINHDPAAIAMHIANHPETEHYCESVWDVDPREATRGRPVGLAWFSPDCKHFSKAKGGKPVEKNIRGLAWVAVRWAATVRPRVIMLENVEEFKTWGPLIPARDPKTGRLLKRIPVELGEGNDRIIVSKPGEFVPYDLRVLVPDPRKKGRTFRSFVNALRRYGYRVEWRELRACDYGAPTIRKRLFLIARCDGHPIVWPEPTHGDPNSEEVKSGKLLPWRTAAEIIDWSITCPSIFERRKPLAENTMRRIARGIERFVINNPSPFIVRVNHSGSNHHYCDPIDEPFKTVTSKNGWGLVTPTLIQMGYGERPGQDPRVLDLDKPIGTVTAGGNKFGLAAAFLAKHYGGGYTGPGNGADEPLSTVTTIDHNALLTSHLIKLRGTCQDGQQVTEPMPTITAGGLHVGEVRAFLVKYYGSADNGQQLDAPLHTVTTKDRFGLITIAGIDYQIIDIGMRMLEPHELFAAQGFPIDYIIDRDHEGNKYSKAAQVARCGNAVPPPFAEALVRANLPELCTGSGTALTLSRFHAAEQVGQLAMNL